MIKKNQLKTLENKLITKDLLYELKKIHQNHSYLMSNRIHHI